MKTYKPTKRNMIALTAGIIAGLGGATAVGTGKAQEYVENKIEQFSPKLHNHIYSGTHYSARDGEKIHSLPYGKEIDAAAKAYDINPITLASIVGIESQYNPKAQSSRGAYGLCQLMEGTAKDLKVDRKNPMENLLGCAKYLRENRDTFNSEELAIAAHNAGPGAVKKGKHKKYKETRDFIKKVDGIRDWILEVDNPTYEEYKLAHANVVQEIKASYR